MLQLASSEVLVLSVSVVVCIFPSSDSQRGCPKEFMLPAGHCGLCLFIERGSKSLEV